MKPNRSLFFLLSAIFICSILAILFFQRGQEKSAREQYLFKTLNGYNKILAGYFEESDFTDEVGERLLAFPDSLLRIAVTDSQGNVFFENFASAGIPFQPQGKQQGVFVSKSDDEIYYYSSFKMNDLSVCTALPYAKSFDGLHKKNAILFTFVGLLSVAVLLLVYFLLKRFYTIVDRDEVNLKRQLTQNISHELKTPVSTILGYTETILANKTMSQEQQNVFVERSYVQAKRLQSLLEDITMLNKLDDARDLYEKTHCNLASIIQEVVHDLEFLIEQKQCTLELSIPDDLPIFGNYALLYSIFRNLLDNALKYAGENSAVSIRLTENAKRYYNFSFSDTGKGVAEEHLPHLFDRFYRVEKGRNRKSGGTGLGLSIVKNAVIFHHGNIVAKNVAGGGLCFDFSLKKY